MEYKCNNIELIDTGMGLHVEFRPLDDDPDKYFLLQKHFEDDQSFFSPVYICLLYTSPSPRDLSTSRMPSSA